MTAPNETLRTILPIAGWGDGQAADVVFTGGADPVLPTPFRIGAAGVAILRATGLAARTERGVLSSSGHTWVGKQPLHSARRCRSFVRTKHCHGLLSYPGRALV